MGLGKKKILSQGGAAPIDNTGNFNTVLYTGNNSSDRNITGVGFNPDLTIVKNRTSGGENWGLGDTVRGGGFLLYPNLNNSQVSSAYITPSAVSDGFKISTGNNNFSNNNYAAWNFRAGGAASSNTSGSITSQVSANTEAGFSIVKYAGNSSSNGTVGTGLSSAAEIIIVKNIDNGSSLWSVYNSSVGANQTAHLNTSAAYGGSGDWNSTTATNSVFSIGSSASGRTNSLGQNHIAYCFHSVDGRQKVGSYTGTGGSISAINVGFEPRLLLIKSTSSTGNWAMLDNKREGTSLHQLSVNDAHAEYANQGVTFTSTGFSPRQSQSSDTNTSGVTFIYLAIG